jgi:hypothetical protein
MILEEVKVIGAESRMIVVRIGGEKCEVLFNGYRISVLQSGVGDEQS